MYKSVRYHLTRLLWQFLCEDSLRLSTTNVDIHLTHLIRVNEFSPPFLVGFWVHGPNCRPGLLIGNALNTIDGDRAKNKMIAKAGRKRKNDENFQFFEIGRSPDLGIDNILRTAGFQYHDRVDSFEKVFFIELVN